jgi:phospholipid/cholesterol/gamma-HCH transport system substrate-binding protein
LADNLNRLLGEPEPFDPTTGPTATGPAATERLTGVLDKLGKTLDAFNAVLGDTQNQQNIKQSLDNLTKATASANDAMASLQSFAVEARQASTQAAATVQEFRELAKVSGDKLDDLTDQLIADAQSVSDVLASLNRAITKIEAGEGTAGKLINDPQLYNDLLAATRQLTRTLQDFGDLARSWKETGVPIKVK